MTRTEVPIFITRIQRPSDLTHVVRMHHRDYPEESAEAESVDAGARHLLHRLMKARDSIASRVRRARIDAAIEDVESFLHEYCGTRHLHTEVDEAFLVHHVD